MKNLGKLVGITVISLASLLPMKSYGQDKQADSSFVDSVMTESEKYPTTIHFIYNILGQPKFNFNDINKLDSIIENVENKFPKKQIYNKEEVIQILTQIDKEIKNKNLHYILNKFDCDDISCIYLACGEKLNLPLYGVEIPFHMFVRYDPDGKHNALNPNDPINKDDFNWETIDTTIMKIKSDEHYRKLREVSEEEIKKKEYLKNLTKQELIAKAYLLNAMNSPEEGWWVNENLFINIDYNFRIQGLNKAAKLDISYQKDLALAYYKRGEIFLSSSYLDLALKDFFKSRELDSNFKTSYYYNGLKYKDLEELKKANVDFKKSR